MERNAISGYEKTIFEAHASNGHLITHDIYRRGSRCSGRITRASGIGRNTVSGG